MALYGYVLTHPPPVHPLILRHCPTATPRHCCHIWRMHVHAPSATARCSPLIPTFQALLLALHHNPYTTTAPLVLDYSGSDVVPQSVHPPRLHLLRSAWPPTLRI